MQRRRRPRGRVAIAMHVLLFHCFVASTAAPIATGWSDPVAAWESHPLKNYTFSRHTDTQVGQAPAPSERTVERFRLANGLKVILRPIKGSETSAVLVVVYDIGEDHDPEGHSGLAHAIEHLYATAPAGEAPAQEADDGLNAQTGDRYTAISAVFPANQLDRVLADAAARMRGPKLTPGDLDRDARSCLRRSRTCSRVSRHGCDEQRPRWSGRSRPAGVGAAGPSTSTRSRSGRSCAARSLLQAQQREAGPGRRLRRRRGPSDHRVALRRDPIWRADPRRRWSPAHRASSSPPAPRPAGPMRRTGNRRWPAWPTCRRSPAANCTLPFLCWWHGSGPRGGSAAAGSPRRPSTSRRSTTARS